MVGMLGVMKLRNSIRRKMDRVDPELVIEKLREILIILQKKRDKSITHNEEKRQNSSTY